MLHRYQLLGVPDPDHAAPSDIVFASAVASLTSTFVRTPVDAVKIAAQNHRISSRAAFLQLWRTEGVRGVFRGPVATLTWMTPATVVWYFMFEYYRHRLQA